MYSFRLQRQRWTVPTHIAYIAGCFVGSVVLVTYTNKKEEANNLKSIMGIRNTIPLKDDIGAGKGKFSVCQKWVQKRKKPVHNCIFFKIYPSDLMFFTHTNRKESSDSHVAIVHSDAIELMILDKRGNIQQQHVLDINELIVDEPDEIQVWKFETQTQLRQKEDGVQSNTFLWQVLWCDNGDEPLLIIAHTNHLLRVIFDCSTKTWKADINRMLDQQGWISSLASFNGYIYTGEIDNPNGEGRRWKEFYKLKNHFLLQGATKVYGKYAVRTCCQKPNWANFQPRSPAWTQNTWQQEMNKEESFFFKVDPILGLKFNAFRRNRQTAALACLSLKPGERMVITESNSRK